MIPAHRQPEQAETVRADNANATPGQVLYSATVEQPGCNLAGDAFRTHRATAYAQPRKEER